MSSNLDPTEAPSAQQPAAENDTNGTANLVTPPTNYILAGLAVLAALILACILLTLLLGGGGGASLCAVPSPGAQTALQPLGQPALGAPFTVKGTGYTAGETVEVFASTDPNAPVSQYASLGTATAGPDGSFTKDIALSAEQVRNGTAYLVTRGSSSGFSSPTGVVMGPAQAPAPITVTITPAVPGPTPTPTLVTPQPGTPAPLLPDLTYGNIRIDLQPNVDCRVNPQLGVLAEVKNSGPAVAGPFVVNVNNVDVTVAQGAQPNQILQLWVPDYANGANRIIIDSTNNVVESNEQNNQALLNLVPPTLPPQCRPTTTPTSTPDPNASGIWYGRYFNNIDLQEPAVLARNDANLNFDWKAGSPGVGVQNDYFSAIWTRNENFASTDSYEFTITLDDGARVYIDGNRVFDEWFNGGRRTKTFNASVNQGQHQIRVEFYEATGQAAIALTWKVKYGGWVGRYYNTTDRSGAIAMKRDDADILFDWGFGSPDAAVTPDNFSVDWQRTINLPAGTYLFTAEVDDGMRVLIDNQLVIDSYNVGNKVVTATRLLSAGNHFFQVQYVEYGGQAKAKFYWTQTFLPTPAPTITPTPTATLPIPTPTSTLMPTLPPPPPPITDTPLPTLPPPPLPTPTETTVPPPPTDTPTPTTTIPAGPIIITTLSP